MASLTAGDVTRIAERVLRGGAPTTRADAVGPAIPIVTPAGDQDRWFIPAVAGDSIREFVVVDRAGVVLRRSAFGSGGDGQGAAAADWLDPQRIVARARDALGEPEDRQPSGPPVLSYDGSPEHLAWLVRFDSRCAFVAGTVAWEAQRPPTG